MIDISVCWKQNTELHDVSAEYSKTWNSVTLFKYNHFILLDHITQPIAQVWGQGVYCVQSSE